MVGGWHFTLSKSSQGNISGRCCLVGDIFYCQAEKNLNTKVLLGFNFNWVWEMRYFNKVGSAPHFWSSWLTVLSKEGRMDRRALSLFMVIIIISITIIVILNMGTVEQLFKTCSPQAEKCTLWHLPSLHSPCLLITMSLQNQHSAITLTCIVITYDTTQVITQICTTRATFKSLSLTSMLFPSYTYCHMWCTMWDIASVQKWCHNPPLSTSPMVWDKLK